jgi:tetratricopeptide (TPR) repeat protein
MRHQSVSSAYAAAELRARDYRANHDFSEAAKSASEAAEIALDEGDIQSWWAMTYFRAESYLSDADFESCADAASTLIDDASISPQLRAQVHILMAKAHQGSGQLESAAAEAKAATELTSNESDVELNVKARQALIAALADSGKLSEAWSESRGLASVISDELDEQLAGKAYWVIGNVAFLCDKIDEGLAYHELAATTFSPARDLNVWAKFNKASAAMRLAAEVADADTLRCIERAELATDVIGGSEIDLLLLRRNRAHWSYLAGDAESAVAILEEICNATAGSQVLGDAWFLLARAYLATGDTVAARKSLRESVVHFESAGAPHRAQQARELLQSEQGTASFSSRLRRLVGFGRS